MKNKKKNKKSPPAAKFDTAVPPILIVPKIEEWSREINYQLIDTIFDKLDPAMREDFLNQFANKVFILAEMARP